MKLLWNLFLFPNLLEFGSKSFKDFIYKNISVFQQHLTKKFNVSFQIFHRYQYEKKATGS